MRRRLLTGAVGLVLALLAFYFLIGPRVLWRTVGPADQGPVVFATLRPPQIPNWYLVCPEGLCEAEPQMVSPVFECPAADLFERVTGVMLGRGGESVLLDPVTQKARFVERTPIMEFPDTVSVRAVPAGDGGSAIALYSRSLVGRNDFGANEERAKAILSELGGC